LLGPRRLFHHLQILLIEHAPDVVDLRLSLTLRHHQEEQHTANFLGIPQIVSPTQMILKRTSSNSRTVHILSVPHSPALRTPDANSLTPSSCRAQLCPRLDEPESPTPAVNNRTLPPLSIYDRTQLGVRRIPQPHRIFEGYEPLILPYKQQIKQCR
jgi:hypothetical protein